MGAFHFRIAPIFRQPVVKLYLSNILNKNTDNIRQERNGAAWK